MALENGFLTSRRFKSVERVDCWYLQATVHLCWAAREGEEGGGGSGRGGGREREREKDRNRSNVSTVGVCKLLRMCAGLV